MKFMGVTGSDLRERLRFFLVFTTLVQWLMKPHLSKTVFLRVARNWSLLQAHVSAASEGARLPPDGRGHLSYVTRRLSIGVASN